MAVGPEAVLLLLGAALQLALAGFLLFVNFGHGGNRALASVLIVRGLAHGANALDLAVPDIPQEAYWARLIPYFVLALSVLILYFVSVFPFRRRWVPRAPFGVVPFLAIILVLEVLYMADHGLWDPPGSPLKTSQDALIAFYPLIALVLLREFLRAPTESRGLSALLVSAAFALIEFYDVLNVVWRGFTQAPPAGAIEAGFYATLILEVLELLAFVFLIGWLAILSVRGVHPRVGRGARAYLVAMAACFGTFLAGLAFDLPLGALWDLALPLLVGYALLRHQLFGIDLKIKYTINRGTLVVIIGGATVVVAEIAQNFMSETYGWALGGLTAGILLFAIAPLMRLADRVANAAMPGAKTPEEMSTDERLSFYREMVQSAWADGKLTVAERRVLAVARRRLGLSADAADRTEEEALSPVRASPA